MTTADLAVIVPPENRTRYLQIRVIFMTACSRLGYFSSKTPLTAEPYSFVMLLVQSNNAFSAHCLLLSAYKPERQRVP
jgi:hypothetical protein